MPRNVSMMLAGFGRLLTAVIVFATPLAVSAQPAEKVYQVGVLASAGAIARTEALQQRLRELGWIEGRNFVFDFRFNEGNANRLAENAADMVRKNVDVIVATTPSSVAAARRATTSIPIVMVYGPDPADTGVVTSLARPGGNITGLTSLSAELVDKQLELLKAIVSGVSRVAALWNPTNPWHARAVARAEAAARALGIQLMKVEVRISSDLTPAFAAMDKVHAGAMLSLSDPMTFTHRQELADLALKHRLPIMNGVPEYTEAGGLASYWPSTAGSFRKAADYVHRILSGARPSELPVERPTTLEFVINIKTARALGLSVPPAVLVRARADRSSLSHVWRCWRDD